MEDYKVFLWIKDKWKQVVSDSQAYKQFGNAVTTNVVEAIANEIKKTIIN